MQSQTHPRFRKRVPCAFVEEGGQHRGMVLNLSKRGLFVGSRATPAVGSRVWLELSPAAGPGARDIPARVVWKRVVHRSAGTLADGGIGLEIEGEWDAYERFFEGQVPIEALQADGGGGAEQAANALEMRPKTHAVRLAMRGTPRTRVVEVAADGDDQATEKALAGLDGDWQVMSIAPVRSAKD